MESESKPARKYRHHSPAFKQEVVQASFRPDASVAQLAQAYRINANQIFAWRKAYRDGTLQASMETRLLPIQIDPAVDAGAQPKPDSVPGGVLEVIVGAASMRVTGHVDPKMLKAAIDALFAR